MSQFSLILYSKHGHDLPFRTKQTIATDNKCILFHNISWEMVLEIFNAFGSSFVLLSHCRYQQKSPHHIGIEMALVPPFYDGYILVESLSLFISYFAPRWGERNPSGNAECAFLTTYTSSYAFSMRSTISAFWSWWWFPKKLVTTDFKAFQVASSDGLSSESDSSFSISFLISGPSKTPAFNFASLLSVPKKSE